ncbi:MAG: helicase, partial [Myxococcota bacterium]|nr:helicase [Myxococcota bacterium]
ATDAAREGVNLQNHCYDLFHFDIPWNPGRLEQRNGRIDRKLQKHHEVNCSYFVLPQRAEDRVLDVLVQKTRRIHEELGSLSPVVEQRISHALQWGISHRDAERLSQTLQNADQEQNGVRVRTLRLELGHDEADARLARLRRNLDELRELLEKSRRWIGFEEPHFRDALSASLETLGVGRLHEQDGAGRWRIPHLHERKGADPSWAATLDSLRAPRKAGQSPAEWRREAPIRPVVFSDPGNLDGEVVHLHLEHRVVQRLLGRFLSMGFRDDALSRACVLRCDEAQPMVVLLGRLSLFGERGARLHDKVLAAAAQWFEPEQREALHPLPEDEREQVLQRVEKALAQPRLMHSAEALQKRLRACAAADVAALEPLLQRNAAQLRRQAERELGKRADAEARAMSKILEEQRARIRKRQDELETTGAQRELAFDADEKRQLEADRKHWLARLDAIAEELASEPERVRASYGVKAARVEPVGLVYLWPLTG